MRAAVGLIVALTCSGASADDVLFERDVRPILKQHCFQCHGEEAHPEGKLDLRLVRTMTAGGDSGTGLKPGDHAASLIYQRIADGEMPPDRKNPLTEAEKSVLATWIDSGAKTARPEPETLTGPLITDEERSHWSFQPVKRPELPAVKETAKVRTPVDRFVLARLEKDDLTLGEEASRRTLVRRLTLDLWGLAPTPEEVKAFLEDKSTDAYEKLVERLLASPRYGERWGRHWLDVAGYADSDGYGPTDVQRPHAWHYRDYVIQSVNDDLPFDRFITEQLAGDELITSPINNLSAEDARLLAATGFLRMAPDGTSAANDNANLAKNEVLAETLKIVSTSLMGMTVGCAQCHDHRYDPIPQADYYALRAVFEPALDWKNWKAPKDRLVSLYTDADREAAAKIETEAKVVEAKRLEKQKEFIAATIERELLKFPEEEREAARKTAHTADKERTPEQKALVKKFPNLNISPGSLYLYDRKAADELQKMQDEATAIRAKKPKESFLHALVEPADSKATTHLFHRGDIDQPKQELKPAGLTVVSLNAGLSPIPDKDPARKTSGRRLALAKQLTDPRHPLTSRVLVNRVWHHHFGRGIVSTLGDFGALGNKPTHPELLDWLADEFVSGGWSLKSLHRVIVLSQAYRQSSAVSAKLLEVDPDNLLLGRAPIRRLEAEAIRDASLQASGQLNEAPGGEPVPVMADNSGRWVIGIENLSAGRPGPVIPLKGQEYRRSVYVQARRSRPLAVLDTFDWPSMSPNCELRRASTVPPQSLMLMNSDFVIDVAKSLATRVTSAVPDDAAGQVSAVWNLVYARPPAADEAVTALSFLVQQAEHFRKHPAKKGQALAESPEAEAMTSLCQMLLSSNEFLYVD
ncbi:MAG TPA: PSD1 and planctomycete cytochrome C domain-containing protein [Caulifigura sp.]|nr:PSD1 and planctomycete cytochrome C domain-containing protein [Caulifigura sp.]